MALQVALIADDLTGALDSASPFAARGLRTEVALSPAAIDAVDACELGVLAVTTNSRELDEASAAIEVHRASSRLAALGPRIIFKKIDSRLKGHIGIEARQCAIDLGRPNWLVAPAIPAFGRIVRNAHVEGHGVAAPIDIVSRLGRAAEIPDVQTTADFLPLVDFLLEDQSLLAIGARGLAEALAQRLGGDANVPPRPAKPILFAVGSVDPITRAQLARLVEGTGTSDSEDAAEWGDRSVIILSTPELKGKVSTGLARDFARRAAPCISALQPKTLVLTGGETAAMVLAALGIDHITVEGEALPGIGQALALTDFGPLRLLTKSGGFGSTSTLLEVFEMSVSGVAA